MKTLLFKNFLRSKVMWSGLFILFLSSMISLEIGKRFLLRNLDIETKTIQYQQETINRYVSHAQSEMGDLLYYLRFGLINETPQLAGLAIGIRDINPSVKSVTIRGLEEQRYGSDLMNPMYQLLGNLDFSFVLIYFFPLIVLAFGFNLISEEKEEGTWSLIRSQTATPLKMIKTKMYIRIVSVISLLVLILTIAKFYLVIPLTASFLAYGLIAILYVIFWFCLTWLVVSFLKSSNQNAQILLILWVLLTMIIPAGIHEIQIRIYPIPEAYNTILKNREGYHTQWDKPKEPTIAKFHQEYPQFASFSHPEGKDFGWLWYFAMQEMGDLEAAKDAKGLQNKLKDRTDFTGIIGLFVPTIHTQHHLNAISLSGLENQLSYLKALEDFHEEKRLYFYPKIFNSSPILDEKWDSFIPEKFEDQISIKWSKSILPLLLISLACLFWAKINFNKHQIF